MMVTAAVNAWVMRFVVRTFRFPLWAAMISTAVTAFVATALGVLVLILAGEYGDPEYWYYFAVLGAVPYAVFAMGNAIVTTLVMTSLRALFRGNRTSIILGIVYFAFAAIAVTYAFVIFSNTEGPISPGVLFAAATCGLMSAVVPTGLAFSTIDHEIGFEKLEHPEVAISGHNLGGRNQL